MFVCASVFNCNLFPPRNNKKSIDYNVSNMRSAPYCINELCIMKEKERTAMTYISRTKLSTTVVNRSARGRLNA